jgi:hypothetical protein
MVGVLPLPTAEASSYYLTHTAGLALIKWLESQGDTVAPRAPSSDDWRAVYETILGGPLPSESNYIAQASGNVR